MTPKEITKPAWWERHPAKAELQSFISGSLSPAETRTVVRHLLRGCAACSRETRILWNFGEEPLRAAPAEACQPGREVGLWP
jgi:hypothetical protein